MSMPMEMFIIWKALDLSEEDEEVKLEDFVTPMVLWLCLDAEWVRGGLP